MQETQFGGSRIHRVRNLWNLRVFCTCNQVTGQGKSKRKEKERVARAKEKVARAKERARGVLVIVFLWLELPKNLYELKNEKWCLKRL